MKTKQKPATTPEVEATDLEQADVCALACILDMAQHGETVTPRAIARVLRVREDVALQCVFQLAKARLIEFTLRESCDEIAHGSIRPLVRLELWREYLPGAHGRFVRGPTGR